ncbi:MAG: hypothetical protein NZL87_06130, partial [Thermomicrobium sp.]|nr:hypothetical protein [Thermomicrobium sp.]
MTGRWRGLLHGSLILIALLVGLVANRTGMNEVTSLGSGAQPDASLLSEPVLATVPPTPLPPDPAVRLERARRLLAAGSPVDAAQLLASVLGASDPGQRLEARLLLARALFERGDARGALELAADAAQR